MAGGGVLGQAGGAGRGRKPPASRSKPGGPWSTTESPSHDPVEEDGGEPSDWGGCGEQSRRDCHLSDGRRQVGGGRPSRPSVFPSRAPAPSARGSRSGFRVFMGVPGPRPSKGSEPPVGTGGPRPAAGRHRAPRGGACEDRIGPWVDSRRLDMLCRVSTPHRGLWLDSSHQTPAEAVKEMWRRLPAARLGTGGPARLGCRRGFGPTVSPG